MLFKEIVLDKRFRAPICAPIWLIFANYATHKSTNTAKNSYICISTDYSI